MKQALFYISLFLFFAGNAKPQREVYHRDGKTLTITNQDKHLSSSIIKDLKHTFFTVYPELKKQFNPQAQDTVHVLIDTSYNNVAYTSGDKIVIGSQWLHQHPHDTDLLTHELMHVVQAYPPHSGPGWLTEGIADYVRYKYGLHNDVSGWELIPFNSGQSYKNSYRITARFLLWTTQYYNKNLVKKIDDALRNRSYNKSLWKKYTGKSLDELWATYSKDSELAK